MAVVPNLWVTLTVTRVKRSAGGQSPIATKILCTKTRALTSKKYVSEQGINVPKL